MQKFKANHLIHAIDLYQELLIADQPDSVSIDSITRYLSSEGYNINDRLARKLLKEWKRDGEVVTKEQMLDTRIDLTEAHKFLNKIILAMEMDLSKAEETGDINLKELVYNSAHKYLDIKLKVETLRVKKDIGEEAMALNRISFNE